MATTYLVELEVWDDSEVVRASAVVLVSGSSEEVVGMTLDEDEEVELVVVVVVVVSGEVVVGVANVIVVEDEDDVVTSGGGVVIVGEVVIVVDTGGLVVVGGLEGVTPDSSGRAGWLIGGLWAFTKVVNESAIVKSVRTRAAEDDERRIVDVEVWRGGGEADVGG